MSERAIRFFVPFFLLVYFVIGFGRWITLRNEVFPIGAWGMFHRIDKKFYDYDMLVHRIGSRVFDPPARVGDPDDPTGMQLTPHQRLVLNGYFRFTLLGRPEKAERYKQFIDRNIVGPDADYEILRIHERSRPSEQDLVTESTSGILHSDPGGSPPDPEARFAFADTNFKFQIPRPEGVRRVKNKKSGL